MTACAFIVDSTRCQLHDAVIWGLTMATWFKFQAMAARIGVPVHQLLEMTAADYAARVREVMS